MERRKKLIGKNGLIFFISLSFMFTLLSVGYESNAEAKKPVKIAWVMSLTGPASALCNDLTRPAQLAVEQINEAGGILGGRKVELLIYDDKLDPAQTANVVKKAIYRDKVDAVAGFIDAGLASVALPIVKKAGLPFISVICHGREIGNRPGEYGVLNAHMTAPGIIAAEATMMQKMVKGPIKVVAMGPETPFLYLMFDSLRAWSARPDVQIEVLNYIGYPIGSPDISAQVLKAGGYNPDVIWSMDWTEPSIIQSLKVLKEIGYKGKFFGVHHRLEQNLIDHGGKLMEGTYWSSVWDPAFIDPKSLGHSQEASEFLKALNDKFPGKAVNAGSPMPYSAIMMILKAMDKAGSVSDLKKIHQALNEINFVAPTGQRLKVEECGLIMWDYLYLTQVQNGKAVVIDRTPYRSFSETYITGLK